jgi:hypothetical protein
VCLNVGHSSRSWISLANRNREKDEYLRAAYGTLASLLKTRALVQAAAKILGFHHWYYELQEKLLGLSVRLAPLLFRKGLTGGAKLAAQARKLVTDGLIPGAVADFILTDPREGNLSNSIRDLVPEQYRDNVAFALAAKEDDNPWINRLRSTFEGGPLNAAGNGITALIFGNKAARKVLEAGGSKDEALGAGIRAASDKSDELMKADVDAQELERVRWTDAQEKEMLNLQSRETNIQQRLEGLDPEDDVAIKLSDELEQVRLAQSDLENTIFESADANVKYEPWESQAAIRTEPDFNNVVANRLN